MPKPQIKYKISKPGLNKKLFKNTLIGLLLSDEKKIRQKLETEKDDVMKGLCYLVLAAKHDSEIGSWLIEVANTK